MKPIHVEGTSIADTWFRLLYELLNNDEGVNKYKIDKGSYEGTHRLEFQFVTAHIKQPAIRPFLPEIPADLGLPPIGNYINDPQEAIDNYMPYLASPEKQPDELYTYGERINVGWQFIIEYYKAHGWNTNRLILEIGRPEDIFLYNLPDGHTPCLRLINPRIYDGKLHYIIYFRSWDLWSGFPINLGGIQTMKEAMVEEIGNGLEDGELIVISPGLHIYEHVASIAYTRLRKEMPKDLFTIDAQ